ncbi:MAG: MFS transporter [Actinomycetota bacterium]
MELSSPLRRPAFRRLALSFTVNELGDWLGVIALAVLVFDRTGSALATTALFLGTRFAPALLAPALVVRAERTPPRFALPVIYCGEAAAFAALALLADDFSLAAVVVLATLDGTLALCGRSLTRAVAAALLKPAGELRSGNAILNIGFTGGAAVGPALAGVIVAGLGVQAALLLDAVSFYVIACVMLAGPLPRAEPEPGRWRERLRGGIDYIGSRVALRRVMTAQAAAFIFFAAVIPIEVIYAKETLQAGDSGYGALLASWGVGMVLGSLLFAAVRRASLPKLLLFSTLAVGAAYLGMAAAPTLLVACCVSVVGGAGNGVQWVALVSAVQEMTRTSMQARVMSVLESIGAAMPGVGYVLGGFVAAGHDPRAAFLVAGIGVIAVVALAIPFLARTPWVEDEETTDPAVPEEDSSAMLELRLQGASPEH